MSEGLHRIGPRGVTTPFEMDPFLRLLAWLMAISMEKLTALVEQSTRELRKITLAMNDAQRAIALLADPLRELA